MESNVMLQWHWFGYHFTQYLHGREHNLCYSITQTLYEIQEKIPEVHESYISKIVSLSGREMYVKHYDQLMQVLAELVIIKQLIMYNWEEDVKFEYEPIRGASKKNPELLITAATFNIGIEVKSPEITEYRKTRQRPVQLPFRSPLIDVDIVKKAKETQSLTLPKDNVIKDFLISANDKFKEFKKEIPGFIGILVIVWDLFAYEPISALTNSVTGLFTDNSYYRDKDGNAITFENVDYVVITSHLAQLTSIAGDLPNLFNQGNLLDYGIDRYPFKIVIKNPKSDIQLPQKLCVCLQLNEPNIILGAEYQNPDIIFWH